MGKAETFDTETGWARAAELLDRRFPLSDGSHADAADYLLHFGQLLVIGADGVCRGLARPAQLVACGGDPDAPRAIVLEQDGLRVEIEPCNRLARAAGRCREHRLRRLATSAAA